MSLSRGTSQMRTGFVLLTSSLTPPFVFLHYPFPHPWQCPIKMVLVCVGGWGARSKVVVQISAEKLSTRKKEFQVAWDDFCRNSGISLFCIYPLVVPSSNYGGALYTTLMTWNYTLKSSWKWIFVLGFCFQTENFGIWNVGFHCPDPVRQCEVNFWPKATAWASETNGSSYKVSTGHSSSKAWCLSLLGGSEVIFS